MVNSDKETNIRLMDFVDMFDKDDWAFQQIFVLSDITQRKFQSVRKWVELNILDQRWFKNFLLFICIIQEITLSLYGWPRYKKQDLINGSLFCYVILVAKIIVRILCMGHERFYYYSKFPPLEEALKRSKPLSNLDLTEIENVNRFNLFLRADPEFVIALYSIFRYCRCIRPSHKENCIFGDHLSFDVFS